MLASLESLINPSNDPNNHIGLSYFRQKDKVLFEQKVEEAAVNFSISVAVVGGPHSGKNTLLSTECQEMNEYIKKVKIKGRGIQIHTVGQNKVRINYYVAPGNEIYVQLSGKLLTGLAATLYLFDVNDERGLDYLDDWLDYSRPKSVSGLPPKKFMIGNKIDTPGNRIILSDMAREFAEINSLEYFETCAIDRVKVHALFQEIASKLVAVAIESAKPLPNFDQKLYSKNPRKPSFLSRLLKPEELGSSRSLTSSRGSTDMLKPTSEIKPKRNSIMELVSESADDDEVFYRLNFQKGVSVARKVRVFQRRLDLQESPLINEGTLVVDWM